ncbi:dapper homolog 3-like [Mesocricetus auratus]|uniref:Dapper homolog 3-like n=1 Tax=Mesocricetus auratus TaxID=10036 RepID=A0ABM2W8I9_MESAU|nr:dapper homolog 3-like [Mesocricetus auratus]
MAPGRAGRAARSRAPAPGRPPALGRRSRRRRYRGSGRRPRDWPDPSGRRCRAGAGGRWATPRRILDAVLRAATRASLRKGGEQLSAPPRAPPPAAAACARAVGEGRAPGAKDDVMLFGPRGPGLPEQSPQCSQRLPPESRDSCRPHGTAKPFGRVGNGVLRVCSGRQLAKDYRRQLSSPRTEPGLSPGYCLQYYSQVLDPFGSMAERSQPTSLETIASVP